MIKKHCAFCGLLLFLLVFVVVLMAFRVCIFVVFYLCVHVVPVML